MINMFISCAKLTVFNGTYCSLVITRDFIGSIGIFFMFRFLRKPFIQTASHVALRMQYIQLS